MDLCDKLVLLLWVRGLVADDEEQGIGRLSTAQTKTRRPFALVASIALTRPASCRQISVVGNAAKRRIHGTEASLFIHREVRDHRRGVDVYADILSCTLKGLALSTVDASDAGTPLAADSSDYLPTRVTARQMMYFGDTKVSM